MAEGFWLFDGLEEEPYGLLPLANLNSKGGPTSTKNYQRIASYQWYLDEPATILMPGLPLQSVYYPGGRLAQDRGLVLYDANHMKVPQASLDPLILTVKRHWQKIGQSAADFSQFHFVTDAVNLQKLFAFCQQAGDGLFRIDVERVGKTVFLNRVEASDLMEIGHVTFDQALKQRSTKARSKFTHGPFYQICSYQFGQFKILVRYQVDCADYGSMEEEKDEEGAVMGSEREVFGENGDISVVDWGRALDGDVALQLLATSPQGSGFPFFTWAQLLFTGADQQIVGWFKGNGDMGKPALYNVTEVGKLVRPLPLAALSKVHDCLNKISQFMTSNEEGLRCGLVWKGRDHLEIFSKTHTASAALSPAVRLFLSQNTI